MVGFSLESYWKWNLFMTPIWTYQISLSIHLKIYYLYPLMNIACLPFTLAPGRWVQMKLRFARLYIGIQGWCSKRSLESRGWSSKWSWGLLDFTLAPGCWVQMKLRFARLYIGIQGWCSKWSWESRGWSSKWSWGSLENTGKI